MKKIKLREATNEQIASNVKMNQREWLGGSVIMALVTDVVAEKQGNNLVLEVSVLETPYNYTRTEFGHPRKTTKYVFEDLDWDTEIEVLEDDEYKNYYWIIDVRAGCETGYSFSVKYPKKGLEGDSEGKLNDEVALASNIAGCFANENDCCGCGVQGPFEADDWRINGWIEDAIEIKLDNVYGKLMDTPADGKGLF